MGPSDFHLPEPLEKHQAGKKFATGTDVKIAVTSWLKTLDCSSSTSGYKPWCHNG
jgi:hypothetical protein